MPVGEEGEKVAAIVSYDLEDLVLSGTMIKLGPQFSKHTSNRWILKKGSCD